MNEPAPQPEPRAPEPSPEEIARARMNRPYPRRFIPSAQVLGLLHALDAEKARNPLFGPNDLKPFTERYDAAHPTYYRTADGAVLIFMPGESP